MFFRQWLSGIQRKTVSLAILICSVSFIHGCIDQDDPNSSSTSSFSASQGGTGITAQLVKGVVSGASCLLKRVDNDTILSSATSSASGTVNFGSVAYRGAIYVLCSNGAYVDETTGTSTALETVLRSADNYINGGNTHIAVTPLTELAVRRALSLGGLTVANIAIAGDAVANEFGLGGIDIFKVIPKDINRTHIGSDAAGEYALVLALISKLVQDGSEGTGLAQVLSSLNQDMNDDGGFDATTKNNLSNALDGFLLTGHSKININPVIADKVKNNVNPEASNASLTTASPNGGDYVASQLVALSTSKAGATIYYTLDGSQPNSRSHVYTAPIRIAETTILRYYAEYEGVRENVKSQLYTINALSTIANPVGGTYSNPVTVALQPNKYGATIHYTLDGSVPSLSSAVYSAPIPILANTKLRYFSHYQGAYEALKEQQYAFAAPVTTATPAGGNHAAVVNVTLASSNAEAVIYYTTDGSIPSTNSSIYQQPLRFDQSTTIRYFSVVNSLQETLRSQQYTIIPLMTSASPSGGSYVGQQRIALSANKPGATIYYTVDGSQPNESSNVYLEPIIVNATTTLRYFSKYDNIVETPKSQDYLVGEAPRANDASLQANASGGVFSGQLTASGTDLTFSIVQQPDIGSVSMTNVSSGSFSYQASAGACAVRNVDQACQTSFVYRVTDAQTNLSDDATVTVTLNRPPVASNAIYLINPRQSVSGQLSVSDVDGDALTYSLVGSPELGEISLNASTGAFTYSPDPLYQDKRVSVRFRATDSAGNQSAEELVTFVVDHVEFDTTPLEFADGGSLAHTLNNTADGREGEFSYSLVQSPQKGRLSLNASGQFTYTANSLNASGLDNFVYRMTHKGKSVDAAVVVELNQLSLNVPDKIRVPSNSELRLYLNNLVRTDNVNNYLFEFKVDGLAVDSVDNTIQAWVYNTSGMSPGYRELDVTVSRNGILLAQDSILLEVYDIPQVSSARAKLLLIGDSITNSSYPNLLKVQIENSPLRGQIDFLGTKEVVTSVIARHEGHNGMKWSDYVLGNVSAPDRTPFFFQDTGRLDITRYFNEKLGGVVPDHIVMMMGVNDLFINTQFGKTITHYAELVSDLDATSFDYAETFIAAVRQAAPNAKIYLATIIPPGVSDDGFAFNINPENYRKAYQAYIGLQLERFGNRESENIYVLPVHHNMDTVNDFSAADSIHPAGSSVDYAGYFKIAHSYFNELIYHIINR